MTLALRADKLAKFGWPTLRYLCYLLFKPESIIPHGVGDSVDRQVGDLPYDLSK